MTGGQVAALSISDALPPRFRDILAPNAEELSMLDVLTSLGTYVDVNLMETSIEYECN